MDAIAAAQSAARLPVFVDSAQDAGDDRAALLAGLRAGVPHVAPKYFYDLLGSRLFEAICELPEYYLTRTEANIMQRHGADIARAAGRGATLVDLGAGNCEKAERLFGPLQPAQYVAVDISTQFLRARLQALQERHPHVPMVGVGMDFTRRVELPDAVRPARRLFFYPGSSIGNFTPAEAVQFLGGVRLAGGARCALLMGVDLVKDKATLDAAYDDSLGVTAAFNLNVLNHLNRILAADFDVRDWRHVAFFDPASSRIDMFLEARRDVSVRLPGGARRFVSGERIHTESSYKYDDRSLRELIEGAGFAEPVVWTDERRAFAVVYAPAPT
jgi:dimethylhistidine N-methyltransferase